jgi:hypothetical protein
MQQLPSHRMVKTFAFATNFQTKHSFTICFQMTSSTIISLSKTAMNRFEANLDIMPVSISRKHLSTLLQPQVSSNLVSSNSLINVLPIVVLFYYVEMKITFFQTMEDDVHHFDSLLFFLFSFITLFRTTNFTKTKLDMKGTN